MRIDLNSPDSAVVDQAAAVVRQGGVILYPTDTIYGLGCDPFQEEALQRLIDLKGRPQEKGLLLLVSGPTWLEQLAADIPSSFRRLADELWPGPVTFLLHGALKLSPLILGQEGKVGIRCPGVRFLDQWMESIPGPLVSTSANRSGEPPPRTLAELRELFLNRVDLFLEAAEPVDTLPSTVIDLTASPPEIVREGQQIAKIKNLLREIC